MTGATFHVPRATTAVGLVFRQAPHRVLRPNDVPRSHFLLPAYRSHQRLHTFSPLLASLPITSQASHVLTSCPSDHMLHALPLVDSSKKWTIGRTQQIDTPTVLAFREPKSSRQRLSSELNLPYCTRHCPHSGTRSLRGGHGTHSRLPRVARLGIPSASGTGTMPTSLVWLKTVFLPFS